MNNKFFNIAFMASLIGHGMLLGIPGFKHLSIKSEAPKETIVRMEIEKPMLLPKIDVLGEEKKFKNQEKRDKEPEMSKTEQKDALSQKVSEQKPQEEVKVSDPSTEEMLRYQDMVKQRIQEARAYPEWAKRRGIEGAPEIAFTVLSNGACSDTLLLASSGSKILDEEAFQTVKRAAPFPAFPKELNKASLRMRVAIIFSLQH